MNFCKDLVLELECAFMLQTLVYAVACVVPFGIFIWSMFVERGIVEVERKRKRDELDLNLKR
jgi:hypothetical protein